MVGRNGLFSGYKSQRTKGHKWTERGEDRGNHRTGEERNQRKKNWGKLRGIRLKRRAKKPETGDHRTKDERPGEEKRQNRG
jgi:hypothetical protein